MPSQRVQVRCRAGGEVKQLELGCGFRVARGVGFPGEFQDNSLVRSSWWSWHCDVRHCVALLGDVQLVDGGV